MSDISREELDARLAQSKAETELIATNMRREMAEWREQQNSQMSQLNLAIATISSKIDGKMDSVDGDVKAINGKFEGIQGQITGINTAISGIQAGISIRLAIFGAVIAVIVALPSIFSAFKDSPTPQQAVSQPIVIQIPQQQATPPQVQSQDKSK